MSNEANDEQHLKMFLESMEAIEQLVDERNQMLRDSVELSSLFDVKIDEKEKPIIRVFSSYFPGAMTSSIAVASSSVIPFRSEPSRSFLFSNKRKIFRYVFQIKYFFSPF